jgi:hypothetical protein
LYTNASPVLTELAQQNQQIRTGHSIEHANAGVDGDESACATNASAAVDEQRYLPIWDVLGDVVAELMMSIILVEHIPA